MNLKIFRKMKEQAVEESERLAVKRGEAPDMEGTGRHNTSLAITLMLHLLLFVFLLHQ